MNISNYPLKGMDSASCVINNQTLIIQSKKLFVLNGSGTKIWELSDGRHAIGDIVEEIKVNSRKPEDQIRKETENFIEELVERQVLVLLDHPLGNSGLDEVLCR
ncbi:MAG: PqqD family protein [Actinobacteria bacterium]|nr:PqqD family protein [Actinomycetota bacterium]